MSSRVVRKSLSAFYKAHVYWMFYSVCTAGALYTGMLLSLGMNQKQIGWIMSLPMFMLPMQIVGAVLQQKYFHRQKFWLTTRVVFLAMYVLMALLVAVSKTMSVGAIFQAFSLILILANIAGQLGAPIILAWQTDVIPERESTVFWNRLTSLGLVAGVAAGFVAGWLADKMGRDEPITYVVVLSVCLIFAILSTRAVRVAPDPDPLPKPGGYSTLKRIRLILRDSNFLRISGVFSILSVAGWLMSAFTFVHLQQTMKFTMLQMQFLGAISCLVAFFAARIFGIAGRRYGRKPILLICTLVKGVEFILWGTLMPGDHWLDLVTRSLTTSLLGDWAALPTGFASAVPAFLLGGFVNVGISSMQLSYMRSISPGREQTLAISMFFAITGFVGGITSSISGILHSWLTIPGLGFSGIPGRAFENLQYGAYNFGLRPFNILALAGACIYFLNTIFISRLREEGAAPTMHVVRVLLENNPLRSVYHAQMLSAPLTETVRMELLSRARGRLLEDELVRDLFSCSSRVREGAMRNIMNASRNMEPTLGDALVKLLEMPALGMRVETARTLGAARYKPALPTLVTLFDSEDPDLAAASIYAAGLIADPAVIPDLHRILHDESFHIEKAWAAEALSRLGDHSEARTVFSAFPANTDPVLQTQCLVSICRCMFDGQKVYKIFDDEMRNPGTATIMLCDSIAVRWQGLDLDTMVTLIDKGSFREAATMAITPELEFCLPFMRDEDTVSEDIIKAQFADDGSFANEMLEDTDYVATSLWLQLRLWTFLGYMAEDNERFVLLAVLFLCDTLGRRLDPGQPRIKKDVSPGTDTV